MAAVSKKSIAVGTGVGVVIALIVLVMVFAFSFLRPGQPMGVMSLDAAEGEIVHEEDAPEAL